MSFQAIQGGKIAGSFKTPVKNYQVAAGSSTASVELTRSNWNERLLTLTAMVQILDGILMQLLQLQHTFYHRINR